MSTATTRLALAAAALALAGGLGASAFAGGRVFSPGALSAAAGVPLGGVRSHAALARACGACHVAPWSGATMATRCLACHTDIQAALRDSSSLHGAVPDARACRGCHTEHHGATASLTRFDAKGVAHDRFGFALAAHRTTTQHRPFACADCHPRSAFAFRPDRCESCHRGYQPSFMAAHKARWGADCQACHDGADRFGRGRFDHARTSFRLEGAHASSDCVACHRGATSFADLRAAPVACVDCHRSDDRHHGFMGDGCGSCHGTANWKGARFDHAVFPVAHGSDAPVACTVCHPQPSNYRAYTCYGCHAHAPARVAAEHREQGGANLQDCVRCHAGGRGEGEGGEHEGRRGERRGEREGDD